MAEIINLNRARKNRAKAAAQVRAVENRAAHGRPKAERDRSQAEKDRRDHQLDGARMERDDDEPA